MNDGLELVLDGVRDEALSVYAAVLKGTARPIPPDRHAELADAAIAAVLKMLAASSSAQIQRALRCYLQLLRLEVDLHTAVTPAVIEAIRVRAKAPAPAVPEHQDGDRVRIRAAV